MLKEKLIFWIVLVISLLGVGFGIANWANKKDLAGDFVKDLESAQAKPKKILRLLAQYDLEKLKETTDPKLYEGLIKKSPFFRTPSEEMPKRVVEEVRQVVEEKPKKILFKYKGRVQLGQRETVIIEDAVTGKSYFVTSGDKIGDYKVFQIDQDKIILKKEGTEDIVLEAKGEAKQ